MGKLQRNLAKEGIFLEIKQTNIEIKRYVTTNRLISFLKKYLVLDGKGVNNSLKNSTKSSPELISYQHTYN